MGKALGVLSCITAVYAVFSTLYVMGAVASGLPAGVWTSVVIVVVWLASASLAMGAVLLMFGQRHSGVVLKPASVSLAIIGTVLTVQSLRFGGNLPLIWWLVMFPTLLALLCAAGSIALRKTAPQ